MREHSIVNENKYFTKTDATDKKVYRNLLTSFETSELVKGNTGKEMITTVYD